MTLSNIVFIIALFIIVVDFVIVIKSYDDETVVVNIMISIIVLLLGTTILNYNDFWASKNIYFIDSKINKIEKKISECKTDYDVLRYQTKLKDYENDRVYYLNIIKDNNKD